MLTVALLRLPSRSLPPLSLDNAGQLSRVKGRVGKKKLNTFKDFFLPTRRIATDVEARRVVRLTLQLVVSCVASRPAARFQSRRSEWPHRASCVPGCKITQGLFELQVCMKSRLHALFS